MTKSRSWIGQTLSERYEIQELLGQGGMSAVYKAYDPNLRRVVAVKLVHQHLSNNPEFVRRFEEEAAAVAQLRHPNIIQVYDFTHDNEDYYIVFEFVPGETLQGRIKRLNSAERQMEAGEAVDIAAKTADALQYAHTKGLIHRDVKPANIMLNVYGEPIVMDFGIAKMVGGTQHTATGAVLGTARYMSPEQIKGERIDPRTDVYSLGVTMFEMLGGRPPFEADSAMTLMMMHMTDPVPDLQNLRADISPALVNVVNKSLAKDPNGRYETAAAMAHALRNLDSAALPVGGATTLESRPVIPDPGQTVLDTAAVGAATAAASTAPAKTAESLPPPPPPPTRSATATAQTPDNNRNVLFAVGAAVLLLIIAIGIWSVFFRDSGGGENPPVIAEVTDIPQATAVPTNEPAVEPEPTEAPPTDIPEPEPTDMPPTELPPTEPAPLGATADVDSAVGDVLIDNGNGPEPVDADTIISVGTEIVTGLDGQLSIELDDGSFVQVAEESKMIVTALAEDITDATEASAFTLDPGTLLLRQLDAGNMLLALNADETILATLQFEEVSAEKRAIVAKRALQSDIEEATLSVRLTTEELLLTCFSGVCTIGENTPLAAGEEAKYTVDGELISMYMITTESESYQYWQEACSDCLPIFVPPVLPTATPLPPTATPAPTAVPTEPAEEQLSARISGISEQSGAYVVSYETFGYTEQVPGQHVHFYWDTVPESQAGVPGGGPWKLYGGPRPFTGYTVSERPAAATAMCIRVANSDHSIILGSGNCWALP